MCSRVVGGNESHFFENFDFLGSLSVLEIVDCFSRNFVEEIKSLKILLRKFDLWKFCWENILFHYCAQLLWPMSNNLLFFKQYFKEKSNTLFRKEIQDVGAELKTHLNLEKKQLFKKLKLSEFKFKNDIKKTKQSLGC